MPDKPSSSAFAKALPRGSYFVGQFALPGLVPDLVKKDGVPARFERAEDAEAAAAKAMAGKLALRTSVSRKHGEYRRLSGSEFAVALADTGLSPSQFAQVYGVPQARVMGWIDGSQDIPHVANVFVRLLQDERNRALADQITAEATR